jgi:Ni,Fe-hydrogenase III large subunit
VNVTLGHSQLAGVSQQVARENICTKRHKLTGQKKLYGWKNLNKRD